jgi:tRNA 2-thiouridine synthesizing protein A
MENVTANETLDCRGLSCPMPTLKTKKALSKMGSGEVLEVLGTDPGTKNDMEKFAKKGGHEYLGFEEADGYTRYFIKAK